MEPSVIAIRRVRASHPEVTMSPTILVVVDDPAVREAIRQPPWTLMVHSCPILLNSTRLPRKMPSLMSDYPEPPTHATIYESGS
jgi:hypothetical protein